MQFRYALLQINARQYAVCAMRNFSFDGSYGRADACRSRDDHAPAAIAAVACRPVAYRRGDDDAVMVRAVARSRLPVAAGRELTMVTCWAVRARRPKPPRSWEPSHCV